MENEKLSPEEEDVKREAVNALNKVMEMQQEKAENPFTKTAIESLNMVLSFTCFNSLANAQEDPKKFIDDFFNHYEKVLRMKLEDNVNRMEELELLG